MKILKLIVVLGLLVSMTSCPKPFIPDFCDRPNIITINSACYDKSQGISLSTSPLATEDNTTKLNWSVYILPDTTSFAPYRNPKFEKVVVGNSIIIPDSLLNENPRLYVELQSTCANKAVSARVQTFVKRFNKESNCFRWEEKVF